LIRKPEGKKLLLIPKRRWKCNIKMNLKEIWYTSELNATGSGQGTVANFCERGSEPSCFQGRLCNRKFVSYLTSKIFVRHSGWNFRRLLSFIFLHSYKRGYQVLQTYTIQRIYFCT